MTEVVESGRIHERKEKLRWYLKESIRLQKKSEELEEQAKNYLDIVDHSFTEAQHKVIWDDFGHGLSSVESFTKAVEEMESEEAMKLNTYSEEELSQTKPGYGVIFIKVAEGDVRSTEFFSAVDGTLRTATYLPSVDLHEWIDAQHRESQEKVKEEVSK